MYDFVTHLGHTVAVEKVIKGTLNIGLGVTESGFDSLFSHFLAAGP